MVAVYIPPVTVSNIGTSVTGDPTTATFGSFTGGVQAGDNAFATGTFASG